MSTAEQEWKALLSGAYVDRSERSPLRFIPSNPRCKLCKAPFRAPGGLLLRPFGFTPWAKNPNICGRCFKEMDAHAKRCPSPLDGEAVAGAEVELSMLFADVRGSSKIARQMPSSEFTRLMSRFYDVSKDVLFGADAIVEKFVGDEVVALFLPFMTGPDHARRRPPGGARASARHRTRRRRGTMGAARRRRAHRDRVRRHRRIERLERLHRPRRPDEPDRAPRVAGGDRRDLGDRARDAVAGRPLDGLEHRHLSLKGHPADAVVYPVS
jgi:hypothetical protein